MMAFGSHGNDGDDDNKGDDGESSDEGGDESQQTSTLSASASAENLERQKHSTAMLFALSLRSSVLVVVVMTR